MPANSRGEPTLLIGLTGAAIGNHIGHISVQTTRHHLLQILTTDETVENNTFHSANYLATEAEVQTNKTETMNPPKNLSLLCEHCV